MKIVKLDEEAWSIEGFCNDCPLVEHDRSLDYFDCPVSFDISDANCAKSECYMDVARMVEEADKYAKECCK
ncbi:MAG: hypothetical protein IJS40_01755 [Synergistaceae bacterium]|nr:hypothetical protein [Synergistaceae bacterium]